MILTKFNLWLCQYIFFVFLGTLINLILLVPLFRLMLMKNHVVTALFFLLLTVCLFITPVRHIYMSCSTLNMYCRWVRFTDQLCKTSLASGTFCCILQILYCTLFMLDHKVIWAQPLQKMKKVHISRNVWTSIFPQIVDIRSIFRPIFFTFSFTTLFFKG